MVVQAPSYQNCGISSIEPFVLGVEGGDGDIYDSHFAYRSMATAGLYKDGSKRFNRHELAIEFHLPFALKDKINLCELFVVMNLRILFDVNYVHRGQCIIRADKGPPRKAARALYSLDIVELFYHIVCHILLRKQPQIRTQ